MDSLEQLSLYELDQILNNAFEENDYETVGLILAIKELSLQQHETQPRKKKRRQTRRISNPVWQTLTPILESHLE